MQAHRGHVLIGWIGICNEGVAFFGFLWAIVTEFSMLTYQVLANPIK